MRFLACFLLCIQLLPLWGQEDADPAFTQGISANVMIGNRGNGVEVVYHRGSPARQVTIGLELRQVRDPREAKIEPFQFSADRGRRYVFNKLNRLTLLNPMIGLEWSIMPHSTLNLIDLKAGVRMGPSIGLINPYYLEICRGISGQPTCTLSTEPFTPSEHNFFNIYGRAGLQAPFNPTVQVGLSTAAYTLIDFSGNDRSIKALRLGVHADGFAQAIPLLDQSEDLQNRQLFVSLSAAIQFGTRW
jgi:hypothetical protein